MSKSREGLERIRDLPDDELGQALTRAREELFRLKLGNYTNQVENTMSVRAKRREVARIETVTRARNLGLETQATKRSGAGAESSSDAPVAAKPAKAKKPAAAKATKATKAKAAKPAKKAKKED